VKWGGMSKKDLDSETAHLLRRPANADRPVGAMERWSDGAMERA
jgi:hypothetical protein